MVKFQDPPPSMERTHGKHYAIAAELKSRPGEWALIAEATSPSVVTYITRGLGSAYTPAGSFEAVSRLAEGHRDVYARYVGENGEYR